MPKKTNAQPLTFPQLDIADLVASKVVSHLSRETLETLVAYTFRTPAPVAKVAKVPKTASAAVKAAPVRAAPAKASKSTSMTYAHALQAFIDSRKSDAAKAILQRFMTQESCTSEELVRNVANPRAYGATLGALLQHGYLERTTNGMYKLGPMCKAL